VVVERAQHERAAVPRCPGNRFVVAEPERTDDSRVERTLRMVAARGRGEREAHEARAAIDRLPVVDADQRDRLDIPGGFLEGLAHGSRGDRLAGFDVSRRLVETQSGAGLLLDEEVAAVALDDRRDGENRPRPNRRQAGGQRSRPPAGVGGGDFGRSGHDGLGFDHCEPPAFATQESGRCAGSAGRARERPEMQTAPGQHATGAAWSDGALTWPARCLPSPELPWRRLPSRGVPSWLPSSRASWPSSSNAWWPSWFRASCRFPPSSARRPWPEQSPGRSPQRARE